MGFIIFGENNNRFYVDGAPPVITGEDVIVRIGDENAAYIGLTANDNYDGDITDKITTVDEIYLIVPGTYSITYSVKDTWNNECTFTRNVTVIDNYEYTGNYEKFVVPKTGGYQFELWGASRKREKCFDW